MEGLTKVVVGLVVEVEPSAKGRKARDRESADEGESERDSVWVELARESLLEEHIVFGVWLVLGFGDGVVWDEEEFGVGNGGLGLAVAILPFSLEEEVCKKRWGCGCLSEEVLGPGATCNGGVGEGSSILGNLLGDVDV